MSTVPTPLCRRRLFLIIALTCVLGALITPNVFVASAGNGAGPAPRLKYGEESSSSINSGEDAPAEATTAGIARVTKYPLALQPATSAGVCGFVFPTKDPGPMDCFTKLVADNTNDPADVGERTPVIFIHGIHGNRVGNNDDPLTATKDDNFQVLINYLSSNTSFRQQFKIYRFHYKSDFKSVWEIARSLRNRIDDLVQQNPKLEKKTFILIAHSMGGLVARSYMNEHDTDYGPTYKGRRAGDRIIKLITLATPHHGSPVANGGIRLDGSFSIGGHPLWGGLFTIFDNLYWAGLPPRWCLSCANDPASPNRADLRYDNRTPRTFNGYVTSQGDVNGWLRQMPHTYDHLITAYWGYIGSNTDIVNLGKKGPSGVIAEMTNRIPGNNEHLKASVVSVLLERVWTGNFVSDVSFVYNDGLVPIESAKFDGANVAKRIKCVGYDHEDMKDGGPGPCSDGKGLARSVLDEVLAAAPQPPPTRELTTNPASSWAFGDATVGSGLAKSITLMNSGTASLTVSGVTLTGPNADQFSLTAPPAPFDIAPNGSRTVTVTFSPKSTGAKTAALNIMNNSTNAPAKSLDLSGGGGQAGCSLSLSGSTRSVSSAGGTGSFNVSATGGCAWSARTDFPWISVSTGGQTVNYSVSPNGPGGLRVGTIIVQGGGKVLTYTITQDGTVSSCNPALSESYKGFDGSGGSDGFTVALGGDCLWSATSDSPWVTINNPGLHVGTLPVSYTVSPNAGPYLRVGTIKVQGAASNQVFTVAQDGNVNNCSYSLSSSQDNIASDGGPGSFTINATGGCQWQVSSRDSWITLNSTNNGDGTRVISYAAAANAATSPRVGSIVVQGTNSTQVFTVNQDGQPVLLPHINLPTAGFQAGDALVGTTIYQGVLIQNTGQGSLAVGSVFRSSGSADFDVLPYGQNQTVAPGGTASVTVKLTPSSTGSRSATFSISSNDTNNPTVNFTVTGNGVNQLTGGIDFVWANKFNVPGQAYVSSVTGVTINNVIYVVGDGNYKYDPTLDSWGEIAQHPFSQYGAADVINGKIYQAGFDPFSSVTGVIFYDPSSNSWGTGASMPAMRLDVAAAAANGKLYVFGGRGGVGADPPTTSVYEYNPASNSWAAKASMPTARMGAVAVSLNGLIYVIGGMTSTSILNTVEVYDPASDKWAARESMPSRRAAASAFVINNKIYVAGGRGSDGFTDRYDLVEEFDPYKPDAPAPGLFNAWAVRNHLLTGRYIFAAGAVNNKAYVIGGINSSGAGVYTVEEGVLAASPKINLPVNGASFGDVSAGNIGEKGIEVQNLGNTLLTVSVSRISGSGDFTVFRSTDRIDQGRSYTFKIRFTPSATGSKSATFRVTSNDPNKPSVDFTVTGSGVAAPAQTGTWQVVNSIPISDDNGAPLRLAINNGKAYIVRDNRGSGVALTVLDLATNAVVGGVSTNAFPGAQPGYVSVSGNRAYLALGNLASNGQLAVINTDNNSVVNFIPVGVDPYGVGFVGGKVYVSNFVHWANGDPATVKVVDPNANAVTNTVTVGRGPTQVIADADAGRVYVTNICYTTPNCSEAETNNQLKSLSVIDAAADSVAATIPLPYNPNGVALAGNRAYVCTGATVEVVDLSSYSVVASIPIPEFSGAIAATPEYVLVLNSSRITVISTATNSIAGYVDINSPGGIAVDPATNLVYVTRPSDKFVSVLRLVAPAFLVSTNSQSLAAAAGGSTAFTTSVSSIDGFGGPVSLNCEGLPTGATCQFAQNPVTVPPNGSVSTTLTINVPAGTVLGSYSIRVVGSGDAPQSAGATQSAAVVSDTASPSLIDFQHLSLTVPTCDFSLSAKYASVGTGATNGSVSVGCTTGCAWTSVSNASWISITSGASGSSSGTVSYSIAANAGQDSRTGTITIAGQTFTVIQAGASNSLGIVSVTPAAGRVSGGQVIKLTGVFVNLSAVMVGGISAQWSYTNGAGDTSLISVTTPGHAVGAVSIDLVPAAGSTYSKPNAFAYLPTSFTDDPLVPHITKARAQHILELRQAVDALRAVAGLPQAQWTNVALTNFVTPIQAADISELRTYLEEAALALGYAKASYTDPDLGARTSVIRGVHIEELRLRIKALAGT